MKTMILQNGRRMVILAWASSLGLGTGAAATITPVTDAATSDAATQGTDAIKAAKATAADETIDLEGPVESVDLKNNALQIRNKEGGISNAVIGPKTTITRNGKPVKLSRVRKGNVVSVKNAR